MAGVANICCCITNSSIFQGLVETRSNQRRQGRWRQRERDQRTGFLRIVRQDGYVRANLKESEMLGRGI